MAGGGFGKNSSVKRRWKAEFMQDQSGLCYWCHRTMTLDDPRGGTFATFDHLKPRKHGGSSAKHNLVLACRQCNEGRGAIFSRRAVRRMHVKPRWEILGVQA